MEQAELLTRRGYFDITEEIYHREWVHIEPELRKVFTSCVIEPAKYGLIRIHGHSELFEPCVEGESKQYDCIVHSPSANQALISNKLVGSITFKLI